MVEQRAFAFGRGLELSQQIGELLNVPAVDVAHDALALGRLHLAMRVFMVPVGRVA